VSVADPATDRARTTRPTRGLLVVIAGPSGVGKGTVWKRVLDRLPDARFSVSATTRAPRPDEVGGVAYHFVTRADFQQLIESGELIEWAEYAGNLYGTPRSWAQAQIAAGHVVILDIEVQGALQIRDTVGDALLIFLAPPDLDELERRLRGRGTEDDEIVERRLDEARRELDQRTAFDVVVVNDDVDRCVGEVVAAIETARQR
jgi:guanylate kinase